MFSEKDKKLKEFQQKDNDIIEEAKKKIKEEYDVNVVIDSSIIRPSANTSNDKIQV